METQTWRKGDIVGDGRFEILQELGAGGFGITYLAQDHVKKQRIAIKTLNSNQQREKDFAVRQKKFESEGFTLRGFRHPHIVRVYEKVEINGLLGFVMEYIPGQDLAKYVRAKGRLSEKESLLYIDQISLALDYVHQDTFLHRDVNPRNIMLREDRREAVLIDFGLAREFAELEPIYLSNTDGSELYKPVEQYEKRGVFGPPTDIYALAVTLYHLLNGAPLGSGKNWIAFTSIARKMNYGRDLGEESDRELWAELIKVGVSARTLAAIQAGMGIEPEQRPKTMTEFRDLLGLVPATTAKLEPSPVVVIPTPKKLPSDLAVSIATNPFDLILSPVQPIVTTTKKADMLPGVTASNSMKSKSTEDLNKKEEPHRSTDVPGDRSASPQPEIPATRLNKRPLKTTSPVSRRLILQGLLGTGGLAGFGFVGLLLKNLFGSQPISKSFAQGSAITDAANKGSGWWLIPLGLGTASLGWWLLAGGKKKENSTQKPRPLKPLYLENYLKSIENYLKSIGKTIQFTTIRLDDQGKVVARSVRTAQIYKEDLGNGVSLPMVKIPAGSFMMGSPSNEKGSSSNEKPQHKVNLKSFYLGQTEITQVQYQAIMGNNPSSFKGAELPVEEVSWFDAREFCKRLSRKTGKTYDLPSESQWEYACRAGTITPFAFGDTITTDVANYNGQHEKTTAVTTFPPNAFGLFDMHGNVWEWCADTWHNNYNGAPIDGTAWQSQDENDNRVLRGGSWNYIHRNCRSAIRGYSYFGNQGNYNGFRVCLAVART
jgi:formylglycine-generating enzyme required for sulfatase activity/tRNA A-37 threonylcarbamoyl transferase component Bud32